MLISHRHKFIFIHIYKNAGTSITQALRPLTGGERRRWLGRKLRGYGLHTRLDCSPCAPHATATEIIEGIGRRKFEDYFSFAIVRNPWDWQVSLYTFVLKDSTHHQHVFMKSLGSFENYIRWRCTEEPVLQKKFIYSDDGHQLVNFVGRYEAIDADFSIICQRIGVSVELPRLNISRTKPWKEFYTVETRDLVQKTFAADIEQFGYEF
ncbi:MAG: sulfotransferase family 2 domain-containing protein [Opitutaceae bacterium]|jgi:hypothetical protein